MDVLSISKLPSVTGNGKVKVGLDVQAHTFTTHDGIVLGITPVSYAAVQKLLNDPEGKPKIPIKVVRYGDPANPVIDHEAVPTDPAYLQELQDWRAKNQNRMLIYLFSRGVQVDVPDSYVQEQREFFADSSDSEMKYFYVTSLLNASEVEQLSKAITGQNSPSEEGVQQAAATFPGDGERATD